MSPRRRFYKIVTVTPERAVALDGKLIRTPKKELLALPAEALAQAVAAEWEAQGEKIRPTTMLLTKLANTAIDRVSSDKARIIAEMVDYAGSDLVCYRAAHPPDLVASQAANWNPVIDWALSSLDAPFTVTTGIIHQPQPPEALQAVGAALSRLNSFEIAALHTIMTITGSTLIALMLAARALSAEAAWAAAHVDEDFQIKSWGQDDEAAVRRAARQREFASCCRFLELSKS